MHPNGDSGNATLEGGNGTDSLVPQDVNLKAAGRVWIDAEIRGKISLILCPLMVG